MKNSKYKIVLRGKKGGFAKISKAYYYELYYGKKKIVKKTLFHKLTKTVKQKKAYLERLIKKIEIERLKSVKKAQKTRAKNKKVVTIKKSLENKILNKTKKKLNEIYAAQSLEERFELEEKELEDERFESGLNIVSEKVPTGFKQTMMAQYEAIDKEEIDPKNATTEEPKDVSLYHISEASILPFKPKSIYYDKTLIYKEIMLKENNKTTMSTTLKFTLKDKYQIPLTQETYDQVRLLTIAYFVPHLRDFFFNMQKGWYILRVTFKRQVADKMIEQGISDQRISITKPNQMQIILSRTMNRFINIDEKKSQKGFITNYLQDSTYLVITGFSLEQQEFNKPVFNAK